MDESNAALKELHVYKRGDGKYDWHLKVNGDIVATSGNQGYELFDEALEMAQKVVEGSYRSYDLRVS